MGGAGAVGAAVGLGWAKRVAANRQQKRARVRRIKKEKAVELSAPEICQTAKGGFMAKGKHAKCGTTVCAMMSKDNAEKAVEAGAKKAY